MKENKLFEARENAVVVNFESDWLRGLQGFLNQSEGKVKTKAIPNYFGHSL